MFKYLLVAFVFFVTILNGTVLEDKVKNLIGEKEYKIHQNLINLLFKNKSRFIINDQINYYALIKELKVNGLLKLRFNKPRDVIIEFKSLSKSVKAYKILNDTMQSLGYSYFFTKSLEKKDDVLIWKIRFKTEYMLDPVVLLKELQLKNCKVLQVENRSSNYWYYEIDFDKSILNKAIQIEKDEKVRFHKPLKPYMLKVDNVNNLEIRSHALNHWFPSLTFFDSDLKVLAVIKKNRIYKGYSSKIPENTKYIKIADLYNLINIKRGLTIIIR
jgi:hypothetical protein